MTYRPQDDLKKGLGIAAQAVAFGGICAPPPTEPPSS